MGSYRQACASWCTLVVTPPPPHVSISHRYHRNTLSGYFLCVLIKIKVGLGDACESHAVVSRQGAPKVPDRRTYSEHPAKLLPPAVLSRPAHSLGKTQFYY